MKKKIWFYTSAPEKQAPVIFINTVSLYIQLAVKNLDDEEQFMVSAPLEIKLGYFFEDFINKKTKNKKLDIDIFDDEQKPFGWKFYTKGLFQLKNRELDPDLSLRKNRIKEMSIIIARRSQKQEL